MNILKVYRPQPTKIEPKLKLEEQKYVHILTKYVCFKSSVCNKEPNRKERQNNEKWYYRVKYV